MSAQPPQLAFPLPLREFLRVAPDTPPPVIRVRGLTHVSSSTNSEYDYIDPTRLASLHSEVIDQFRSFILSLSPAISFTTVLKLPFRGTCLMTEADVRSYLDTQVIVAAWEAVLKMVPPSNRTYDLMTIREMKLGDGFPDQVFGIYTSTGRTGPPKFTPVALIEMKSPGIVYGLCSTFQARGEGKIIDPAADWVRVTGQLRKYVVQTGVLDVLVMDQHCAIYFRFPSADQGALFDPVEFVVTPSLHGGSSTNGSGLTLREIIVLVCCRALDAKGIKFQNFGDAPQPILDEYKHVLNHQPPTKKGSNPENPDRRVQPKRGGAAANKSQAVPADTDAPPEFRRWELNSVVTLQIPDTRTTLASTINRARAISMDSGFLESLTSQPKYRVAHPPLTPDVPSMTFHVTQLITPTVAVLSSCFPSTLGYSVIGKIPRSSKNLTAELDAYAALANLQGGEIPHCYGVCQVATAPSSTVLLIELISPIKTVQSLRDAGEWETLETLRTPARQALGAIHDAGVVHQDAYARNFLVTGADREHKGIVVVDFDAAKSYPNEPERKRLRIAGDWAFFNEAFSVDEEEWGWEQEEEDAPDDEENTAGGLCGEDVPNVFRLSC